MIVTVDSTLVQSSIRRLFNRQIDACAIFESTLVQPLIRRLCNRRFAAYKKTLFCSREKHCQHQHKNFSKKTISKFYTSVLLQIQQRWRFHKAKSKFQTWPNRIYSKHQGLIFLTLTPKILCKNMNNIYTFSFLACIIYLFNKQTGMKLSSKTLKVDFPIMKYSRYCFNLMILEV